MTVRTRWTPSPPMGRSSISESRSGLGASSSGLKARPSSINSIVRASASEVNAISISWFGSPPVPVVYDIDDQFLENEIDLKDEVERPILRLPEFLNGCAESRQLVEARRKTQQSFRAHGSLPRYRSVRQVMSSNCGVSPANACTASKTAWSCAAGIVPLRGGKKRRAGDPFRIPRRGCSWLR